MARLLLWDSAIFFIGIVVLVGGAEILVRGGTSIATRLGMSPLVIGLTVVAVGTSAPELIVSITASATGHSDVALGNVVGSNILNTFIVLGATAILYPIAVRERTVRSDLPMVLLASAFVLFISLDGRLSRLDGLILLFLMVLFLLHLYGRERGRDYQELMDTPSDRKGTWFALGAVVAGIFFLVAGGNLVVDAGTRIATDLGVPERIIALTLVAFGTSAPELATSLVAALRKQVDLAVGNVVGSNLLNLLLVLGGAAFVAPIEISTRALALDIPVMVIGAAVLLQFASTRIGINRYEGLALVGLYGVYLGVVLGLM